MVLKIINATEARVGTNILIEGEPYTIKKIDISKTGKHGHAKARIEDLTIFEMRERKEEFLDLLDKYIEAVNMRSE